MDTHIRRWGSGVFVAIALLLLCYFILRVSFASAAEASNTLSGTASSTTTQATEPSSSASASSTPSTSSASSSASVVIDTTLPDLLLPDISDLAATTSATSTIISWETSNQVSTGDVLYGTTTQYSATSTSELALDHSVALTGLEPNTTYHFEVVATNGAGTVNSPDQTFMTPLAAPSLTGAPPAISGIMVVPTYSIATISWTTDLPSSSVVWYGTSSSYYDASSTGDAELAQVPTTNHVVTLSGLSPDTTYHFAVVSENGNGLSATSSDEMFATTQS